MVLVQLYIYRTVSQLRVRVRAAALFIFFPGSAERSRAGHEAGGARGHPCPPLGPRLSPHAWGSRHMQATTGTDYGERRVRAINGTDTISASLYLMAHLKVAHVSLRRICASLEVQIWLFAGARARGGGTRTLRCDAARTVRASEKEYNVH